MCHWLHHTSICLICLAIHTASCLATSKGPPLPYKEANESSPTPPDDHHNHGNHNHGHLYPRNQSHGETHEHNDMQLSETGNISEPQFEKLYIQKLVQKYGTDGKFTYDGLINMLENLGISSTILPLHDHTLHENELEHSENHVHNHENHLESDLHVQSDLHVHEGHEKDEVHEKNIDSNTHSMESRADSHNHTHNATASHEHAVINMTTGHKSSDTNIVSIQNKTTCCT